MVNRLNNDFNWLERTLRACCSDQIEYRVAGGYSTVKYPNAITGKTEIDSGGDDFTVSSSMIDFLINAAELGVEPTPGDVIVKDNVSYEVTKLGDGECFVFTSPTRRTYRIHVREIA